MSTYRSSTATLNASIVGIYGNVSNEHEAVLHGLCSANAVALSAEIRIAPPTTLPQIEDTCTRIDQALPEWRAFLPASAAAALGSARHEPHGLNHALDLVARVLAAQERLAMADTSITALGSLGYSVQRVDGKRTSAIEARRGHETFLVVVEEQGKVTTDHAGLADDSCNDQQRGFVEAMHLRGVLFDDQISVQHHDPRGGSPIANAARAGGPSLAHGAVLDGDARTTSLVTELLLTGTVKRQRLSEGGAK